MKTKLLLVTAMALMLIASVPVTALAQVAGQCADCHTMHNSQHDTAFPNGTMAESWNAGFTALSPSDTPFAKLLKRDGCLGCHAGTYNSGGDSLASCPKVLAPSEPLYDGTDTAAGGNFYWVKADDTTGHNVLAVKSGKDSKFPNFTPPGFDTTYVAPALDGTTGVRGNTSWATQLTCAGTNGCHGGVKTENEFNAIAGGHHGVDTEIDGTSIAKSYRFLLGIKGIEHATWEYNATSASHNQYHGEDRGDATQKSDTSTISYLCCECHGAFHSAGDASATNKAASPWLRHPTDFDMSSINNFDGKEYQYYNGGSGTANTYSIIAPVAADLDETDSNKVHNTIFDSGETDAIVTCISCHRAHGSPYADLLRWRYTNSSGNTDGINAAGGQTNSGCFICHTTKDDNS